MGSNLKRSDYPVVLFSFVFPSGNVEVSLLLSELFPPHGSLPRKKGKKLIVRFDWCHFLPLRSEPPASLRMEHRMWRHPPLPPLGPEWNQDVRWALFFSFFAKMSSLWQDHIHNKAFIFLITLFFCFSIYRYLYTLCTCFHDCVFPTVTVRYEKGTKSAAAPQRWGCGRASSDPRQHTASSRKKEDTAARNAAEGGVPVHLHKTALCWKKPLRLAALSLEKLPHATFSVCLFVFFPCWSFKVFFDWPAVTTQCSTEERERER